MYGLTHGKSHEITARPLALTQSLWQGGRRRAAWAKEVGLRRAQLSAKEHRSGGPGKWAPFVYRLGRKVLNLERGVRLP